MPQPKKRVLRSEKHEIDLAKSLQQMQDEFDKEISEEIDKLSKSVTELIDQRAEILYNILIEKLPEQLLNMSYKDFLEQGPPIPSSVDNHNDTIMMVQSIRNKVKNGEASPKTTTKYQALKNLFK
uniref:Nbl1_Borealin_N domain-containing protein n=1 Tax=Strongyloides papillosus TaxID=174720 RepID=A0A0N5BFT8_STREA